MTSVLTCFCNYNDISDSTRLSEYGMLRIFKIPAKIVVLL